jgi:hypothetical protein
MDHTVHTVATVVSFLEATEALEATPAELANAYQGRPIRRWSRTANATHTAGCGANILRLVRAPGGGLAGEPSAEYDGLSQRGESLFWRFRGGDYVRRTTPLGASVLARVPRPVRQIEDAAIASTR